MENFTFCAVLIKLINGQEMKQAQEIIDTEKVLSFNTLPHQYLYEGSNN